LLIVDLTADAPDRSDHGKNFATRSEVWRDMECLHERALASQVVHRHFETRANAIDAAIAANATLGLMEPVSNGIGGICSPSFIARKENKLYGITWQRGRSPLGLSYEQMKAELDKLNRKTISAARNAAGQPAGDR